jgi:GT2 family glycosyltransferase
MDTSDTTSKLLNRLTELEKAKKRLEELEFAYRVIEESKFARVRGLMDDVRSLATRARRPRNRPDLRRELLSTGFESRTVRKDPERAALYEELRKVDAERETFLELLTTERVARERMDPYERWLEKHAVRDADIPRMRQLSHWLPDKPVFSVLMPTYDTDETLLRGAIDSVIGQAYPFWQLCIADDASPDPRVREIIEAYAAIDERITYVFRAENGHISHASNSALAIATGDFIALFDHDDVLTPDALFEFALEINAHPEADMLYSDEDKLGDDGVLCDPHFKPDWSPDSFLSRMYTCHLGVYRRSIAEEIGGFRPGFEGSQDHDFALRFTERAGMVRHIPRVLYHWRVHSGSTAASATAKPYAAIAGQKAVAEAIERRGEPGHVERSADVPGVYVVRYAIAKKLPIGIIMPTRDHGEDVDRALQSIFSRASYDDFEVVVVDNGSTDAGSLRTFAAWSRREKRVRVLRYDHPFNFSRINNFAVANTTAPYLVFLNNDTEVITDDWLEAMVEQAQRPSIGVVGALLFYPDDTVQHAGVIVGLGGVAGHGHKDYPRSHPGYFGMLRSVNNCSALTAACVMMRRNVFEQVGGFDETLAVAFNDVDLCLKVRDAGYNNVFLPHVQLYHYESKSRGREDTSAKYARFVQEVQTMEKRWATRTAVDPCYSPHLSIDSPGYAIRL